MPNSVLRQVRKLKKLYGSGKIPRLAEHEVHPHLPKESRENYLYFTLPPTINFQRNSPAMWRSALATWEDPKTRWVFYPEKLQDSSRSHIQKALLAHNLALQKNRHTDIWITVGRAFQTHFKSDPRVFLKTGEYDVPTILSLLREKHRKDFPYLSGPKMANYWLYILSSYTPVSLKRMEELSIIPDTHVIQSTMQLGLATKRESPEKVALIWKELLKGSEIAPVQMHPVLWNWSRNNFQPEV